MKVLFICSSNICRSPYCEYEFRRIVENDPVLKGKVEVSSAGLMGNHEKMDDRTVRALFKDGFGKAYVDSFKPKKLRDDSRPFDEATVIIGMTKWHKYLLPRKYRSRFMTLSEAGIGRYAAIKDPWFAKETDDYMKILYTMKDYMELYADKLRDFFTEQPPHVTAAKAA